MNGLAARDAVGAACDALRAAGVDDPQLEAERLIAVTLGVDRATLISDPDLPIPPARAREVGQRVRRRVEREPFAYIVGLRGFRYIDLVVDRRVLIPRPETELLVDVALELPPGARVHDVGTGCGAIALALKHERPDLVVSGSDTSPNAVAVATHNAERLGLDVTFEAAVGLPRPGYDLVVANLPYVTESEYVGLAPEITRWEPRDALVSGTDGLDAIRALVAQAPAGQSLALEHGPAQGAAVRDLLDGAETRVDLAGHERVTLGAAP